MQVASPLVGKSPAALFEGTASQEKVGLEIECALVDAGTGLAVPVYGPEGAVAVIHAAAGRLGSDAPFDPRATSVRLSGGGTLSLEMGGAVEYSGPPADTVAAAVRSAQSALSAASAAAEAKGHALITGGVSPFSSLADVSWLAKPRAEIMRRHFAALGAEGMWGPHIMGLTQATQATFDYGSPRDLSQKMYVAVGASPVLAALFVASPMAEGSITPLHSNRMRYWGRVDPARCGFQAYVLEAGPYAGERLVELLVAWGTGLPLIYRPEDDRDAATGGPNSDLVVTEPPADAAGLRFAISQAWPQVRTRELIELRAFDTPPWEAIGAAPAVWSGLLYDDVSRAEACALLAELDPEELAAVSDRVAESGPLARVGPHSVGDVALLLVSIARSGLQRRVRQGREDAAALDLLSSIEEVAATGCTFAAEMGRRGADPDPVPRVLEYLRIPPG